MSERTKIKVQLFFVSIELKIIRFLGKVFHVKDADRVKAKWKLSVH